MRIFLTNKAGVTVRQPFDGERIRIDLERGLIWFDDDEPWTDIEFVLIEESENAGSE